MNRHTIYSSMYFGWSGHRATTIYNRWHALGKVPALPHKGALSAGIRPFTISGVWPWASDVLVLPGLADYDGVRILALQKRDGIPHLVLGTVEAPNEPCHNVDDLHRMGQSVAKSLMEMNYKVVGSTHCTTDNAGGGRKFDVWMLWHTHEIEHLKMQRRKGETPLAVMGRGHPACAGRYAVETSLWMLNGIGLNDAQKYVIMQAVRRDWIAPWRKWLHSWASPGALRVVNVLGSMGFLSSDLAPFGALLLRLMQEPGSGRRVDFALRYPLYTPIWLPLNSPAQIDDAITAGHPDDALRLIHNWMYGDERAAPIKRMKRMGVRWPLIMRFGISKDGSNHLTFGRYKELMEYGMRADRVPAARKDWLLLHKTTSKLKIDHAPIPLPALNRSLRQATSNAGALAVDKTDMKNLISTAAKSVEMVLAAYLRESAMNTIIDLNDGATYNIFKSHCLDAVANSVAPTIDLRKIRRIQNRWHGYTEMARFESLIWLHENGAYPILLSAGISRRMERLSETLWLTLENSSRLPAEQCLFKPLVSLKDMAEDALKKGHCLTPDMLASFMGAAVPVAEWWVSRSSILGRAFLWSIGECTIVMRASGVVDHYHVPDEHGIAEKEIMQWIRESIRTNGEDDDEQQLANVPDNNPADIQGIQFLLMEAHRIHLNALWRRAGKLLPTLRGPCARWVDAHLEPIIRKTHRDATKLRQMFDK